MKPPEVGQLAVVRRRPYVVNEVLGQGIAPSLIKESHADYLVKLSSVEDDSPGEELEVIWGLEPSATVQESSSLPDVKEFDNPKTLDAFLDAVRWGAVSQADDKALQSPFRSGIEIDDYQLDPVVRALIMPRVNLLIADDVGLGKTIEAGLVVQEMILRHRVRKVLIVCPSSLQIQWKEEMRDKFGLEFRIIDSHANSDLRRRRGVLVNAWSHFPRLITSIDFLKRERPLRLFRETLPALGESSYPRRYDLLILDEAHNAAPPGRGNYAIDSLRTLAIRTLVPHFEHKLFLTATPHNGYRESFASLLELLDNQRFARAVTPNRAQLEAVMVRRMKSELKLRLDGSRRFAERKIMHIAVPYTQAERSAHNALQRYCQLRQSSSRTDPERFASEFVLKLLKKRLFSSPAAFAVTLDKHKQSLGVYKSDYIGGTAWRRKIEDAEDDFANDEEFDNSTEEAIETATGAFLAPTSEEKQLLRELSEFAAIAALKADSKAEQLIRWLEVNIRPQGQWSNQRVIIFTEYRATQKWLHNLLAQYGFAESGRLELIFGGMPSEDRERIKAAFQAGPKDSSVRILLATDAASEGLNLQNHCSKLVHYEIPWNPNRMEQRNGRIDRHGQEADEVLIHHFVAAGFDIAKPSSSIGKLEADLEFLMRAVIKVENIREDLGKVGPIIAAQVEDAMLGKRKFLDTEKAEKDAEPVRRMLKFERKLRDQLEKLKAQLDETKRELRLDPENIENVTHIGLQLAGQPPLVPAQVADIWPDPTGRRKTCPVFYLPALSGSWAQCAEGLAHPHTKVIRPIVFDPSLAVARDDIVLAHLNHRLVQMCLRLLRAEIWSHTGSRKIHRVSAKIVPDTVLPSPAIIAHGRIVVLGGDNHRLHEEIIIAGGVIKEGRFSRLNVSETRSAWMAGLPKSVPDFVERRLAALWPKHRDSVLSALESRMRERTKNLRDFLDEKAEIEAKKIAAILTELQNSIRNELDAKFPQQLELWEQDQRERDINALRRRLAEIPKEILRETEHLRSRFSNPSSRLFPVAITYLVPQRAIVEIQGAQR